MLITPAFAQSTTGGGGGDILGTILLFLPLIAIWYFLIIRPQKQQITRHRELVAGLRRGDTIVTNGGLIGKITKVIDDHEIQVELSDGVRVRMVRNAVSQLHSKTEPVQDKK